MSFWSRIERELSHLAGELLGDERQQRLAEAQAQLADGRAVEAERTAGALLELDPAHVPTLIVLGAAHLAQHRPRSALDCFDRALAVDPRRPEGLIGRGEALLAQNQASEAASAFRQAVEHAGGESDLLAAAYRGLGLAHRQGGAPDKAVRELRKALAEDPTDAAAATALGQLLLAGGAALDEAEERLRQALERPGCPPGAATALGQLALRRGQLDQADREFERALAMTGAQSGPQARGDRASALAGRGDAALRRGDTASACQYLEEALALEPRRPELHELLGDALFAAGAADRAVHHHDRALATRPGDHALRRRALRSALAAADDATSVRLANELLAADPHDPDALLARGIVLQREGQHQAAAATFRAILAGREHAATRLALAELELAGEGGERDGDLEQTIRAREHILAALAQEPRSSTGRALLARLRGREYAPPPDTGSPSERVHGLAHATMRLLRLAPRLGDLVADASQVLGDLDRPLLVAVMGEFSSGKSSFINAFLGSEVAPTGITPTTATVNVVQYGRDPGGRILYHSGRAREFDFPQLFRQLSSLDEAAARDIAQVELHLPREELGRVQLVDTPGFNALALAHAQTARDFIGRADAVLWVFSAGQAGKASERRALAEIRRQGKCIVGVLNKIDQLAPGEVAALCRHVQGELGEYLDAVLPLSARTALAWRKSGTGGDGGWRALEATLEQIFYRRSHALKRQVAARRLAVLLQVCRERLDAQHEAAQSGGRALGQARDALVAGARAALDTHLDAERSRLGQVSQTMYEEAAREILELVRPRRLPFGSHQATAADRDYLVALLASRFESALDRGCRAITAALEATTAPVSTAAHGAAAVLGIDAGAELSHLCRAAVLRVETEVYGHGLAFLRGYLRGGMVDQFFDRDLGRITLESSAIAEALGRRGPDLVQIVALPLASHLARALDELSSRLSHLVERAWLLADDLDLGPRALLASLQAQCSALASAETGAGPPEGGDLASN